MKLLMISMSFKRLKRAIVSGSYFSRVETGLKSLRSHLMSSCMPLFAGSKNKQTALFSMERMFMVMPKFSSFSYS